MKRLVTDLSGANTRTGSNKVNFKSEFFHKVNLPIKKSEWLCGERYKDTVTKKAGIYIAYM